MSIHSTSRILKNLFIPRFMVYLPEMFHRQKKPAGINGYTTLCYCYCIKIEPKSLWSNENFLLFFTLFLALFTGISVNHHNRAHYFSRFSASLPMDAPTVIPTHMNYARYRTLGDKLEFIKLSGGEISHISYLISHISYLISCIYIKEFPPYLLGGTAGGFRWFGY